MIAEITHTWSPPCGIKKFFNPYFRVRILFFVCFCLPAVSFVSAQTFNVDSLIRWVNAHPQNDSAKIHVMHRISYMLSETDTKKSFDYYERVSILSDSLHFTFGKALASINLGILLSSAGNYESSTKAFFNAIDLAEVLRCVPRESGCLEQYRREFRLPEGL